MLVNNILKNYINEEKIAHLYIITGLDHQKRLELVKTYIYYFFKDKVSDKNLFEKIDKFEFYSLFYLNSYDKKLKKEEILELQEEFLKSSLSLNERFYIIDQVENITLPAANSLLKFLEEPESKNTYGILLCDNLNLVLDTILSRAVVINLGFNDKNIILKDLLNKNIDISSSILLKEISSDINYLIYYNQEKPFIKLKDLFYKTVDCFKNKSSFLISLINEFDFELNNEIYKNYINFIILFIKDIFNIKLNLNKLNFTNLEKEIQIIEKHYTKKQLYKILDFLYNFNIKLSYNINIKLAFNQLFIFLDNL